MDVSDLPGLAKCNTFARAFLRHILYNMPDGIKCTFLNTQSLHKNIKNVFKNHNLCTSNIIFSRNKITKKMDDTNTYEIEILTELRNNQT